MPASQNVVTEQSEIAEESSKGKRVRIRASKLDLGTPIQSKETKYLHLNVNTTPERSLESQ